MDEQEQQFVSDSSVEYDQVEEYVTPVRPVNIVRVSIVYFGVVLLVSLAGFGIYALFFGNEGVEAPAIIAGVQIFDVSETDEVEVDELAPSKESFGRVTKSWETIGDRDGDGVSDEKEAELGTDPLNRDTDGDFLNDALELEKGTDPLKVDTDGDGITDWNDSKINREL